MRYCVYLYILLYKMFNWKKGRGKVDLSADLRLIQIIQLLYQKPFLLGYHFGYIANK